MFTGSLLTFWLVCGGIAAVIASAKNRNALGWLALGALFPPCVLIVAVMPKLPPGPHRYACCPMPEMQCGAEHSGRRHHRSNAGSASSSVIRQAHASATSANDPMTLKTCGTG